MQFWDTSTPWEKVFVLNGNGVATTVNNGAGANTVLSAVTLNGSCIINAGGTSLTFSSPLGGSGSVTKTGGSPLNLETVNTYTGFTVVNGGTLALIGSGSIDSTATLASDSRGTQR